MQLTCPDRCIKKKPALKTAHILQLTHLLVQEIISSFYRAFDGFFAIMSDKIAQQIKKTERIP